MLWFAGIWFVVVRNAHSWVILVRNLMANVPYWLLISVLANLVYF